VTAAWAVALVAVGTLAGIVSTVVSLASVVSYPALLAFGLPPVSANMTNTVALLFAGAGAAAGSGPELEGQGSRVRRLGLVAALGGVAGAALLLATPADAFERVAPVLIGAASLTLLAPRLPGRGAPAPGRHRERSRGLIAALFCVATYVGYFGAAGGILMLAVLTPMLAEPMARANAVKNVISGLANALAAVAFTVFGNVDWAAVGPLAAGFLLGGWTGPALVRRVPGRALRVLVGACGIGVAVKLAISAYR
jgi:uncharacterized membrane protein YfcA